MAKNIFRGTTEVSNIYRGTTEMSKVYRGNTEIWSAAAPVSPTPPYSPDFYYDATNTTYSSGTAMQDVVSGGTATWTFDDTPSGKSFPPYTSGEYWQWTAGTYAMRNDNGSTSDNLNSLGATSHTLFAAINPDVVSEEDVFCTGTSSGAILLMLFGGIVRHHVWATSPKVTDGTTSVSAGSWVTIGGRFTTPVTSGDGRVDVFVCTKGGTASIENGSTVSVSLDSTPPNTMGIGSRSTTSNPNASYKGQQFAIYRSALSDSEIQDVCDYFSNKMP